MNDGARVPDEDPESVHKDHNPGLSGSPQRDAHRWWQCTSVLLRLVEVWAVLHGHEDLAITARNLVPYGKMIYMRLRSR